MEERFHGHFYNGVHETKLSHLTSVRQERDESILGFVKCFRYINNPCFHLAISENDLIYLALNGFVMSFFYH
jgi:hypothetical protein